MRCADGGHEEGVERTGRRQIFISLLYYLCILVGAIDFRGGLSERCGKHDNVLTLPCVVVPI